MYRGRLWTMRQFAGFGTVEETNKRFRYLLDHGQTGLSTAFDMPTLMGLDSDHHRSLGEVGVEGVALDTVDDMETLFDGIPLDRVTVSMTINAPAAILLAFYVVAAEEKGISSERARRHDPDRHPQGVHRPEGVVLPDRAGDAPGHRHGRVVRGRDAALAPDLDLRLPHPRGRIDRAAGARLHAQERADLRRAGGRARARRRLLRAAAELLLQRPHRLLRGDRQVPGRPPDLGARAARDVRRQEAEVVADAHPHADRRRQLTAQQPLVNIVRTTVEALAGVLGGTQSLHTNSYDEALALPTEDAVRIALRTQQVIAHETGVTNTIDPLGGSYFIEKLTDEMEAAAYDYFARIDELGGMVSAIEENFPQREIADAAFEYQIALDAASGSWSASTSSGRRRRATEIHRPDPAAEQRQRERVARTRATATTPRSGGRSRRCARPPRPTRT